MALWTRQHCITVLPALAVMIVVSIILKRTLGNKSLEHRMIPIQIITFILLALEVGKQTISLLRGYDLYHIPLHFCSLFIFVMPVLSFYKGKYLAAVHAISAAISAAVFMLMLIYPNLIYSAYDIENYFRDFMCFHTVSFHNLVMLVFLLTVFLRLHIPHRKQDIKYICIFILGFCLASATAAQLLKTNYANYYTCNIPPLEALRVSVQGVLGYGLTQLIYILIVSALNVGFVILAYGLYCLCFAVQKAKKPLPLS